ncbi:MAG: two-component system sensor histidine kinase NtrB, partial [Stellaceae bacterium]
MIKAPSRRRGGDPRALATAQPEPAAILAALAAPVIVIDRSLAIRLVNPAAEQFFGASAAALQGCALPGLLAPHSPLLSLIEAVWRSGNTICEYDMPLEGARLGSRSVTIHAAPVGEMLVLSLHERSMVDKVGHQLIHRDAARSMTAMAAMLAHEIKNPLSGIRGAAQLLEQDADEGGRQLTRLICDETDRIVALVDRMESFSDHRPIERAAVNIHEVLERVRKLAQSGFARHARFIEEYDPSLPPVHG